MSVTTPREAMCELLAATIIYQLELSGLATINPGANIDQKVENIKKARDLVVFLLKGVP